MDCTCTPQYSGWRTSAGLVLKINGTNNCVELSNGNIVIVENIINRITDQSVIIIGKCYERLTDFFQSPCPLSVLILGIQIVSHLCHLKIWEMKLYRLSLYIYQWIIIVNH